MLEINTIAPDFTLLDQNSNEHSLSDYNDKWVLIYFYPKDNTPGCTTEACAIRDIWEEYRKNGITVLGISKDSVASHKKFVTEHKLPFTLLSDENQKVITAYGANSNAEHDAEHGIVDGGMAKRISYLINPAGEITKIYPDVDPAIHANEVLKDFHAVADAS